MENFKLIVANWPYNAWTPSEWASWVQAIGSIAALGVAIFVMSRQNRHSAKLIADADRLTTLRRANSVQALLGRALILTLNAGELTGVRLTAPAELHNLEVQLEVICGKLADLRKVLGGIPTFDLGSFDMANGVHTVIDAVVGVHDSCEYLRQHPLDAGKDHGLERNRAVYQALQSGMDQFLRGMNSLKTNV